MRPELQMLLRGMADRLLNRLEVQAAQKSGQYTDTAAFLLVISVFFLKMAQSKQIPQLSEAVREQGLGYLRRVLCGSQE